MLNETSKNVYTAYKDVGYKISGHDGSVLWAFALKQAYEPDRRIGSYLQLDVVNDVVYAALEYRIYALHASCGQELWQYSPQLTVADLAQDRGRIAKMIIDKSVMYLQLTYGDMVALDLHDGSLKWDHLSFPNGGSFSPSDDTLYASEYSIKEGIILHAIDGKTGKERWRFERQLVNISHSATFLFDGIVYCSGNPLYALDARTGRQLWKQHLPADGPTSFGALQIYDGVVYVNTGAFLLFQGKQDIPLDLFRIFAFNAQTGKQLWESKPGYSYRGKVRDGGKSILVESIVQKEKSIQALDAKTGTPRWQIALGAQAHDISGPYSPLIELEVTESHLYVLTHKHPYTLQVFDMRTGKPLGHHPIALAGKEKFDLGAWGHDVLYIRSSVHEGDPYYSGSSTSFTHYIIRSISLADGATSWSYDMGSLVDVQEPITRLLLAP